MRREPDAGHAVVEFLGGTLLLLLPVLYLVLVLGRVQAATFAVEAAARGAGRAVVTAEDSTSGLAHAHQVVGLALSDQGFDADPAAVTDVRCAADPCLMPGAEVTVRVTVEVALPLLPAPVRDALHGTVRVERTEVAQVDRFRELP